MAGLSVPTLLAAAVALFSPTALASMNNQITWANVAFTFHGERTPLLAGSDTRLSPLGSNQLYAAGARLRSRYIVPPTNVTTATPITGISTDVLNNEQLNILSTNDEYVISSALAFTQGLYPPYDAALVDSESILSNESLLEGALGGYQYPALNTVSELDFNSIWVAGNQDCYNWGQAAEQSQISTAAVAEEYATIAFYNSLIPIVFSAVEPSYVNFGNAYLLYDYALFQYNHNNTVYNTLEASDLAQLYSLANQQELGFTTPVAANSNIQAIAGQTLATIVLDLFEGVVNSQGLDNKMSLLFGSFEPLLSFFALSQLTTGPAAGTFNSVPSHGSIMSFELFSYPGVNGNMSFPDEESLWVRFLYSNASAPDTDFIEYPLFGRGNSETAMSWPDFAAGMGTFAMTDVATWCKTCQTISLYCQAIWDDINKSNSSTSTPSTQTNNGISPAIGGVIGATVTLGVLVLAVGILALCGFRVNYHSKRTPGTSGSESGNGVGVLKRSGSGGFKGAEKLASDTDLTLKGAAGATVIRHERVGSWELKESPVSPTDVRSLDKELESGRVVSTADYNQRDSEDLGENPFGEPVKTHDHV